MKSLNFRRSQRGATVPEYVLLLSFLALSCIGTVPALQNGISRPFSEVSESLNPPTPLFGHNNNGPFGGGGGFNPGLNVGGNNETSMQGGGAGGAGTATNPIPVTPPTATHKN